MKVFIVFNFILLLKDACIINILLITQNAVLEKLIVAEVVQAFFEFYDPELHYGVHKIPPLVCILSQLIPAHILTLVL